MNFSWDTYIDLAIRLETESSDEASQRTAISRAYYAAFHVASEVVRTQELCPPGQRLTHDHAWRLFRVSDLPNGKEVAKLGFDLKDARVAADYRNPFPGDLTREVIDAIADATSIIALLRNL